MFAYFVVNLAHEGLGHGGACLAVGGRLRALSSAWFSGDLSGVGPWGQRLQLAGGTAVNLVIGLGGYLWLVRRPPARALSYYVLWLTTFVNLFQGSGYLLASPMFAFGDWQEFLVGLTPPLVWRIGLIALGLVLSRWSLRRGRALLLPLLPAERSLARREAALLCWIPYGLIGGIVYTLAAARNPMAGLSISSSLIGHLGGMLYLVLTPLRLTPAAGREGWEVPSSRAWIVAGAVLLMVVLLILGPSIQFDGG